MMNIVQFWHSVDIPPEIQTLTSTWKELNQDADHVVFNARSAADFMQANYSADVARAFRDITIPAMYCDVFRVAYILRKGGIYVDCGTRCLHPVSEWGIDPTELTLMRKWHGGVWNGLICAPAEHPCLLELWSRIEKVLLNRQDGDIFSLTGPRLFTTIAEQEAARADAEIDADIDAGVDFDKTQQLPGQNRSGRSMNVIDQAQISAHFDLVNQLKHKSRSHWSKLQNVIPLFGPEQNLLTKENTTTSAGGHITVYLANNIAGRSALHRHFTATAQSENPSQELTGPELNTEIDIDNLDTQQWLQQLSESNVDKVCAFVDLTHKVSELCYRKTDALPSMTKLATLCGQFNSCEIRFAVMDQTDAIESVLSMDAASKTAPLEDRIKSLRTNPLLDFNLIDESLQFYFRGSTLSPVWVTTDDIEKGISCLDAAQVDQIENEFAESNENLFEKYPLLRQQLQSTQVAHSAA